MVDFGCVEEGGTVAQTVELLNSSPAEAFYQWDLDCNGNSVFSIHPACGTVRPYSQTTLKAVYKPTQPNAHHRRVACLILHRVGASVQVHTRSQHKHRHHQNYSFCLPLFCLICPVGPHVPWTDWYLSIRSSESSYTKTWALGSAQAPMLSGASKYCQCYAAWSSCTFGPTGSALPPGGGKVSVSDERCADLSAMVKSYIHI